MEKQKKDVTTQDIGSEYLDLLYLNLIDSQIKNIHFGLT